MPTKPGIKKSTIIKAQRLERKAVKTIRDAKKKGSSFDSFQNWGLNLGIGTNNALTGSTYGFNPITRNRTLLEWIHRGSWIGGMAIDTIADDMTREGISFQSTMRPEDVETIENEFVNLDIWSAVGDVVRWGRLYGGAIGVYLIDGQDFRTPLRLETVQKDQFKGMVVLDRWMVESDTNHTVQKLGPVIGQPEFYRVNLDAPALRGKTIHYSRCFRMEGIRVPYWQRVMENLWGISVIERLYDRLVAFDSATQGAAQAVYKCFLRQMKIKDFRQIAAAGGPAAQGLAAYLEMVRMFQGIEGLTVIDAEDDFVAHTPQVQSGIAEALVQFGQQISGATGVPLTRLFGQSPQGLNATGEHDLINYYDGLKQRQERHLRVPVMMVTRMIAQSKGIRLDDRFNFKFSPLWQMSEELQSQIAERDTTSVLAVESANILPQKTILEELRERGRRTGRWTNITDEIIKQADDEMPPTAEELAESGLGDDPDGTEPPSPGKRPRPGSASDSGLPSELTKALESPTVRLALQYPEIDREHDVALLAVSSLAGGKTYIDRHLPRMLEEPGLIGLDPAIPFNGREQVKWFCMAKLGMSSESSLKIAKDFEKQIIVSGGWDWNAWQRYCKRASKRIDTANPPSDPYVRDAVVKHLSWVRPNAFGGTTTGTWCNRMRVESEGMNLTTNPAEVTCSFCKKKIERVGLPKKPSRDRDQPVSEVAGFQVVVEYRAGERRYGHILPCDYGYIRRVPSAEGKTEWMDCLIGPNLKSETCYIVDQESESGVFDEHKIIFGYNHPDDAAKDYVTYARLLGMHGTAMHTATPDHLRWWFENGDMTRSYGEQVGPRRVA